MPTTPFLRGVAQAYLEAEPEALADYCFVFPNKRSSQVFASEMAALSRQGGRGAAILPAVATITEMVDGLADGVTADRLELVFILYGVYCQVLTDHGRRGQAPPFDKFYVWADMLLGDFSDVDMYLVDPAQLFRNVRELRDIQSNYLTPEQTEAINEYLHAGLPMPTGAEGFWQKAVAPREPGGGPAEASGQFRRLWQLMGDLYEAFRRQLRHRGLRYSAMAYRDAVERLEGADAEATAELLPYRRYIFVGFNMLSKAEERLLTLLKAPGLGADTGCPRADFYWDNASPAFATGHGTAASQLMRRYSRLFPPLYAEAVEAIPREEWPRIEVIGVPSRAGMNKVAARILSDLYPAGGGPGGPTPQQLARTAVVLPEEALAPQLLASLGEQLQPVNLTMGYAMRNTAVAGLVRAVTVMQAHARPGGGGALHSAERLFFHGDVRQVLTHPLMRECAPDLCASLLLEMDTRRLFTLPESLFNPGSPYAPLAPVFRSLGPAAPVGAAFDYLRGLLQWLSDRLHEAWDEPAAPNAGDAPEPDAEGGLAVPLTSSAASRALQWACVRAYMASLRRLRALAREYLEGHGAPALADTTVFALVERMVSGESVPFEGRPLRGLQVMGVLEARSLDFDNVIIPSMNESTFPRRAHSRTFIPDTLRVAYEMSTPRHQDGMYAYHFYRLIARARRVWLLHDTRTGAGRSGGPSRYIRQLQYIYRPAGLRASDLRYDLHTPLAPSLDVPKTPAVMQAIERYFTPGSGRALSASAINLLAACPMSFYLAYIEGYRREDEVTEYIDDATHGSIVHDAFQHLLEDEKERRPDHSPCFTREDLQRLAADEPFLEKVARKAVNRKYLKAPEGSAAVDAPLRGEAKIRAEIVVALMQAHLKAEAQVDDGSVCPFELVSTEKEEVVFLKLRGKAPDEVVAALDPARDAMENLLSFNFKFIIDRVDRPAAGGLRVVDYKTGADKTNLPNKDPANMFFGTGNQNPRKAMLQLMLYCQAYAQKNQLPDEPIKPVLYRLRSGAKGADGRGEIHLGGDQGPVLADYRQLRDATNWYVITLLEDLRDPDIPFTTCADGHACRFCLFSQMCRRNDKEEW